MKIVNHRLDGAPFVKANVSGGAFPASPSLIVVHDTAGKLDKGNSVKWLASSQCASASAHFVVERDGSITQMVATNRVAWHAGASTYKGRAFCNSFSIGIEIVNPGMLKLHGASEVKAWFDQTWPISEVQYARTKEHNDVDAWWLDYTPEQIEAVTELCKALVAAYPTITALTTHWYISPRRKVDTTPLFPLEQVAHAALSAKPAPVAEPMALVSDESGEAGPEPGMVIPAADPPKEEKGKLASLLDTGEKNYSKLNELADKGSRVAQIARRFKNWIWGSATALVSSCSMVDSKKGTAGLFVAWVEQHPFLFVAICGTVMAVLVYAFVKIFEKYLVTAYRDGRYTPRG